jgi:antitoxin CptB
MTNDIDQLKKKIIYRSNYRGTKEMDKLLGSFTNSYINELSKDDLIDLERLLDIDDDTLYNYFNGIKTDITIEDNKINILFKNFKYISSL